MVAAATRGTPSPARTLPPRLPGRDGARLLSLKASPLTPGPTTSERDVWVQCNMKRSGSHWHVEPQGGLEGHRRKRRCHRLIPGMFPTPPQMSNPFVERHAWFLGGVHALATKFTSLRPMAIAFPPDPFSSGFVTNESQHGTRSEHSAHFSGSIIGIWSQVSWQKGTRSEHNAHFFGLMPTIRPQPSTPQTEGRSLGPAHGGTTTMLVWL